MRFALILLLALTARADDFLMQQASGTSRNPAAAPMPMLMSMRANWMLMLHGQAYLVRANDSGPRGASKTFSTNWLMASASRSFGGGTLMFRSMLSFEPATISGRKYPELFQTGETAFGKSLIDAQHPHDFFMELAAEYARPIGGATAYLYLAPVGDPALGPVAFPHRDSAMEIPQAPIGHHFLDSTHIAFNVVTAGMKRGPLTLEASAFHGREPDEKRYDVEGGRIDSWSARVTFDPSPNWTAQVSTGHLHHPEALDPHDVQRTTASVEYSNAFSSTSLIYGHSEKNSWVAESVLHRGMNYVTGRGEIVDKDFRIKALTLGYTRDLVPGAGIGTNVTLYSIPDSAKPDYGSSPRAVYVFVRLRGSM
jgi:hypothetical protein